MVKQNKKQSINQIWLSFVFMIVILGNFITVAGIDYYYETNGFGERQSLWVSDSSTEFPVFEFASDYPSPFYDDIQTGQNIVHNGYHQYNRTPAYLGNDTWSMVVNSTSFTGLQYSAINVWMVLPNMDTWLIDNVIINLTLPGEIDEKVGIAIWGLNTPVLNSGYNSASTLIYSNSFTGGDSEMNENIDVSLLDALNIFDSANQFDNYAMNLFITDTGNDGISAFACVWSCEVIGEIVTGWSVESSLLVSVTVWNVLIGIAIVYSLDMFDLGGFIKTIRNSIYNCVCNYNPIYHFGIHSKNEYWNCSF